MKHPKLEKENHGLKQIRKEKQMGKLGLPITLLEDEDSILLKISL